jgi:hypothetical protein
MTFVTPPIRVTRGPIVSEVVVFHRYTEHHVKVYNSPGMVVL